MVLAQAGCSTGLNARVLMESRTEIGKDNIRKIVREALSEDSAWEDVTSAFVEVAANTITAEFVARSPGIAAGLKVAGAVFQEMNEAICFEASIEEGTPVSVGDVIATVGGNAAEILAAERTALNFLQRLSGIATLTGKYVNKIAGTGVKILDTRKTTPLLRQLEKYAVRVGGGENHRGNLSEMILIKENHIRAAGGADVLLATLKKRREKIPIEVEVDSFEFLERVLEVPVDRIMLDNFSPEDVGRAVDIISSSLDKRARIKPAVEVSGGVTLENVASYAIEGVDYISIGAITHSAPALDVSMEVVKHGC